jgi:hypothetical protein
MGKESFKHHVVKATLSGSFHRDPEGLARRYEELVRTQCQVLSPRSLTFEDSSATFVRHKVEQDPVKIVEDHHLQAIALSDFLWVHAPKGYIGLSAALEIGYATAKGIAVFSSDDVADETLKQYVRIVPSVYAAIEQLPD